MKLKLLVCGLLVSIIAGASFEKPKEAILGKSIALPSIPLTDFSEELFFQAVAADQKWDFAYARAGIVPHHTLVSNLIAQFFRSLQGQDVETIILIGPNHKETGNAKVLTTTYAWETPFGLVMPDTNNIKSLIASGLAKEGSEVLQDEQSIAALVSFIKYYLPETRIVPIILRSSVNAQDAEDLANFLYPYINSNTLVVASVDFSHYLTASEAYQKDQQSLGAIEKRSIEQLYTFKSDNLDSPASIAVVLNLVDLLSLKNIKIHTYANSGVISGREENPTTSYWVITFD